jgi:rhodanese-related sulfurtransferase
MNLEPEVTEEISATALASWLQEPEPPLLIDCRELDEWDYNRLPTATHIALGILLERTDFHSSRSVVVYCHHGIRSLHATRHLRRCGAEHCFSLAGGIHVWSHSVDPSVPVY